MSYGEELESKHRDEEEEEVDPSCFHVSSSLLQLLASQMLIPNLKFLCPIHMRQSLHIVTQPNSHGGFAHFKNKRT